MPISNLSLQDVERELKRDDISDKSRVGLGVLHFQLRGRAPKTRELATFLDWPVERVRVALLKLLADGHVTHGPDREPRS
jgi:hypothetical protein